MEPVEDTDATATEATQPPQAPPQKKPRSEAQLKALEAARAKALASRKENAALREKERAVKSHQEQERTRQVEEAYQQLPKAEEEDDEDPWSDEAFAKIEELSAPYAQPKPKPKKRKPARRVIVTEVSSGEESDHSDVEVVLPKKRSPPPEPTAEEVHHQRLMDRMFFYGI